VFAAVLFAAVLHAVWNALVKGGSDKAAGMVAVVIGEGVIALPFLPFAPMPAVESWPYILASVALHFGYQVFLIKAYQIGDLTQVYPIARGVSPLLVALGTMVLLGARFSTMELAAMMLISVGIASISLTRRSDGLFQRKAALFAMATGLFIAAYSIVDGQGARLAGTALGFYGWVAVVNAVGFAAFARVLRPGLVGKAVAQRNHIVFGGSAAFAAYLTVVWAFTQAPIALVTALRETSIVFALLIGVIFLRERLDLAKVLSTCVTLSGAVLMRLTRI
jgi:drug/metabolite transporter (DMT)-like permease